MQSRSWWRLLAGICCLTLIVQSGGYVYGIENGEDYQESARISLDFRMDLGGSLSRGRAYLSPVAENRDSGAVCRVNGEAAAGWLAADSRWNSASLADGWYDASLQENGRTYQARVAVLNSSGVAVHGGVLKQNESWSADKVHLVQHWVRIPKGRTLTIASGAVVKFCRRTGIRADGVLNARQVVFTVSGDDSAGGDTDMNGAWQQPDYEYFQLTGAGTMNLGNSRLCYRERRQFRLNLSPGWNLLSLPGGITEAESVNRELVSRWQPQAVRGRVVGKMSLPAPAGTVLWIYSTGSGSADIVCSENNTDAGVQSSIYRAEFIGIRQLRELHLEAGSVDKLWHWQKDCYRPLDPDASGRYVLQPGKGYVADWK